MNRASLAFSLIAGLGIAVDGAQLPQFRSAAPIVPIDVTVLDRDGHVVTNLQRDDFEVYDEGRRQALTVFDNGLRPITVVIMLDRSASVRAQFGRVKDAAEAFVDKLLPGDRVRIGSFANDIRIDPEAFTDDRDEMRRILDDRLLPAGGTPLWAATARAFDALAAEQGRRVVLVFTDGRDTPSIEFETTFREILDRAREEEPMVYAIGLSQECAATPARSPGGWYQLGGGGAPWGPRPPQFPGPQVPVPPWPGRGVPPRPPTPTPRPWVVERCRESGPDPDLRELTEEGGGGYFELKSTDNLAATFERIAHELHSQYLLGFVTSGSDGRLHALDVRVRRPGLTVRARKSYVAPGP